MIYLVIDLNNFDNNRLQISFLNGDLNNTGKVEYIMPLQCILNVYCPGYIAEKYLLVTCIAGVALSHIEQKSGLT